MSVLGRGILKYESELKNTGDCIFFFLALKQTQTKPYSSVYNYSLISAGICDGVGRGRSLLNWNSREF